MFGLSKLQLIATVVVLGLVVGVPATMAYNAGATSTLEEAREESARAIEAVREQHREAMDRQVKLTDQYRDLADEKLGQLQEAVAGIKVVNTTITRNIYQERLNNPEFYELQVPEGGIKQWEDARNLFR